MSSLFAKLHRRFGPKPPGTEVHRRSREKRQQLQERWNLATHGRPSRATAGTTAPRVAVVGGGFAGLSGAYHLQNRDNPFPVTLYESTRIGGRVYSVGDAVPGRTVEKGGELIGANHPLWIELAQRFGLGLSTLTSEDQASAAGLEMPLYLDGKKLTTEQASLLYNNMSTTLEAFSNDARKIKDAYEPWRANEASTFDGMSVLDKLRQLGVTDAGLLKALEVQLGNDNVAPMDKQSYLGLLALIKGGSLPGDEQGYWTASEIYRCENGNDALGWEIMRWLRGRPGCAVNESAEVTKIEISSSKVKITDSKSGESSYDYVVLAIPQKAWPGGTSRVKLTISPQIPIDMYRISTGRALKYISTFTKRFWVPQGLNPSGMSDELGLTWENTDNQIGGSNLGLTVFAGGPNADKDQTGYAKDGDRYFAERLDKLYPGYSKNVTRPGSFIDWTQVDLINTGYSCPAPGEVCTAAKALSEPFNGRLFFAGEHTCMAFFGYMEGALQSGMIAADRIARINPS